MNFTLTIYKKNNLKVNKHKIVVRIAKVIEAYDRWQIVVAIAKIMVALTIPYI